MSKKLIIFCWAAGIILSLFLYSNRQSFALNPFRQVTLDLITAATMNERGHLFIIDHAHGRMIKTDTAHRVSYVLSIGDFDCARRITARGDYFFMLDITWDAGGLNIDAERVLMFEAQGGRFLGVLYRS